MQHERPLASGGFFTPRAQFRRVLAHDWRMYRNDILWGAFYVISGFYLYPAKYAPPAGTLILSAPFYLLSLAMGVMTYRLCRGEAQPATATFYFNLPRRRDLAQRAHLALLAAMALGHEALILILSATGLRLPPGLTGYSIQPHMILLPFFTIALVNWIMYFPKSHGAGIATVAKSGALIVTVFLTGFVICMPHSVLTLKPATVHREAIDTVILLGLGAAMMLDAMRRWPKVQIGTLS